MARVLFAPLPRAPPLRSPRSLRVTDGPTMEVVEMVLVGKVNKSIVTLINQASLGAGCSVLWQSMVGLSVRHVNEPWMHMPSCRLAALRWACAARTGACWWRGRWWRRSWGLWGR